MCTYLSPNLHFSITKRIAQVLSKPFLSTGKALQFYTSLNTAVSGNSTVNLLVIAFFQTWDFFLLKLLRVDLVLVEKVRMAASCWLFTAFSVRFLVRMCVDFGDAYVAVRTNYMRSFQVCCFPTLPLCFSSFCLQNPKSACMVKC